MRLGINGWRLCGPGNGVRRYLLNLLTHWDEQAAAAFGQVTLYTPEAVDRAVRAPMKRYLRGAVDLIRDAAWTFPAHARLQQPDGVNPGEVNLDALTPEDLDALLDHAFERYAGESGLFGTPGDCLETLSRVQDADVDELACLIDFGVPDDQVLGSLTRLARLRDLHVGAGEAAPPSLGELMSRHGVTHLQCTPSHARLLLTEDRKSTRLNSSHRT